MGEGRFQTMLVTHLVHESGGAIQSELPIDITVEVKELGSLTTYYRRYELTAILGVVADEDTDIQNVPQGRQQGHQNKNLPRPKSKEKPPSRAELGALIMEKLQAGGMKPNDLGDLSMEMFKTRDTKDLDMAQMEKLLKEVS